MKFFRRSSSQFPKIGKNVFLCLDTIVLNLCLTFNNYVLIVATSTFFTH